MVLNELKSNQLQSKVGKKEKPGVNYTSPQETHQYMFMCIFLGCILVAWIVLTIVRMNSKNDSKSYI